MEGQKSLGPCKLDILFQKSVPHILERIFFSLDFETFSTCVEVSNPWKELLRSDSYLEKAKAVFHDEINQDEEKLWHAAEKGNVEEVRSLSSSVFVDVNCVKGLDQSTPLSEAVRSVSASPHHPWHASQINVIELLLEKGADHALADRNGQTPLHLAAMWGRKDVVQLLLNAGADHNKANDLGYTPLHFAAPNEHKDVVELLLNAGAEPNKADILGETPLHDAARWGRKDVVQILLNAGAEPNKGNSWGKTPLLVAHQYGQMDNVNILNNALKKQQ